jgi:DNA-binding MarR family transcriptional regulator
MTQAGSKRRRGVQTRHPHFDSAVQEVFLQLWRTYDRLKSLEDELFGQHQLSAQQYNALRLLKSARPGSMPTLALGRRLISRSPDMTRMLDRLEKRKLIQRKRKPANRRIVEVSITPAGVTLLDELAEAVNEMHERQLGHLSPAKQRQLIELLKEARQPLEDATCDWLDG